MKAPKNSLRQQKIEQALQVGATKVDFQPQTKTILRVPVKTIENGKFAISIGILASYTIINLVAYKKSGQAQHHENMWSFFSSRNGRLAIQGLSEALRVAVTK